MLENNKEEFSPTEQVNLMRVWRGFHCQNTQLPTDNEQKHTFCVCMYKYVPNESTSKRISV